MSCCAQSLLRTLLILRSPDFVSAAIRATSHHDDDAQCAYMVGKGYVMDMLSPSGMIQCNSSVKSSRANVKSMDTFQ
ncbi:hypothetical protein B0H21DRAFT_129861 [Amylocystis lapponica]|nr:hypothetical protein B0H21DRAFT_129861 [Amylocystis lapponica]